MSERLTRHKPLKRTKPFSEEDFARIRASTRDAFRTASSSPQQKPQPSIMPSIVTSPSSDRSESPTWTARMQGLEVCPPRPQTTRPEQSRRNGRFFEDMHLPVPPATSSRYAVRSTARSDEPRILDAEECPGSKEGSPRSEAGTEFEFEPDPNIEHIEAPRETQEGQSAAIARAAFPHKEPSRTTRRDRSASGTRPPDLTSAAGTEKYFVPGGMIAMASLREADQKLRQEAQSGYIYPIIDNKSGNRWI